MYCFKTDETLFEGVLPFHAKTTPLTYAGIGRHIINT